MILATRCYVRQLCRRSLVRFFSNTLVLQDRPPAALPKPKPPPRDELNYSGAADIYFNEAPDPEQVNYKPVTSNDLESYRQPPRRVKMLVRDYIEDSLYNPNYGYFSKQATIVTSPESLDFASLRDSAEFQEEVAKRYSKYERYEAGPGKQLWHTPTEIFKPWYGQSVARCLVSEYLLKYFPYEDLLIYEIGAGNGTLAFDVLNYIREKYPEVYDRTRYTIIEISSSLAKVQTALLQNVHPCVKVVNKSIFHWEMTEDSPCLFLAMEVIDNFAHDMIRYDLRTLEPYQGMVNIDEYGRYSTYYTTITDPLIASFFTLRRRLLHPPPLSPFFMASAALRRLYVNLPFSSNLSAPEFIPTRLLTLLRTLRKHFPRHRLLLSDFSSLPDTIPGINAPVVQTRHQNTTVPCSTLFVQPGYFDIFFPTDFERLRDMYEHVLSVPDPSSDPAATRISPMSNSALPLSLGSNFFFSYLPRDRRPPVDGVASSSGLPVGEKKSSVFKHAEFLETYADLKQTRLKSGENPMLEYYQNVKFLF